MEAQGCDGAMVAKPRLRTNHSGERGPDRPERERAHRRVSRVANGKAKLTVALDRALAQRWPWNRWWTSADGGGGSRFTWVERERQSWAEGANGRGEVGEQGSGVKRGTGARSWLENARTWARPRRGDHGREVRVALTSGVGGAERERARELGRGGKWKRGGGRAGRAIQKGRGGSVMAGERAVVGASTAGRSWARG